MLQPIGRYQDLERIGGDAFGTVYRATDPVLDRPVAITNVAGNCEPARSS